MKGSVKGDIWIETDKGMLIGKGRINLLEKIKEFGSITEAARSMKMSYRQAWEQIEVMNKQSNKPIVVRISGGIGGGGTCLTTEGEKIISAYKNLLGNFNDFLDKNSKVLLK